MKNFIVGLNIATTLAVAVLFYLYFADKNYNCRYNYNCRCCGGFRIAYFESDSIQNHFEYFKDIRTALQAKDQANSKQLNELKTFLPINTKPFSVQHKTCRRQS